MVALPLDIAPQRQDSVAFDAETMAFLNHLRFVAMGCRAMPRANLFEACALLQTTKSKSLQSHAEGLMRCLREALGRQPRLHAPGTDEVTFDEAWLARLGQAASRGDEASMAFLLRSRVARENRRMIGYLVHHISESFSLN